MNCSNLLCAFQQLMELKLPQRSRIIRISDRCQEVRSEPEHCAVAQLTFGKTELQFLTAGEEVFVILFCVSFVNKQNLSYNVSPMLNLLNCVLGTILKGHQLPPLRKNVCLFDASSRELISLFFCGDFTCTSMQLLYPSGSPRILFTHSSLKYFLSLKKRNWKMRTFWTFWIYL